MFPADDTFKIHEVFTNKEGNGIQLVQKLTSCKEEGTMFNVVNTKIKEILKLVKDDNIKTGYTNSSLESSVDIESCVKNNIPVVEFDKQKVGDWVLAFYEFDQMHFWEKNLQVSSEFKMPKVVCFKQPYCTNGVQEFESKQ